MSVGVNIAVSRTLGPEGRGQYALLVLAAITLVAVTKIGLEHANVYLLGTVRVEPERLASQNAAIAIGGGLSGALMLLVAPGVLPSLFIDVHASNLALAAVAIPFMLHIQLAAGLQNLTGLVTSPFRAALIGGAAQFTMILGLSAIGRLDVTSALAANLLSTAVVWLLIVLGGPTGTLRARLDVSLLAQTLRYSIIVHVAMVLLFFQTRLTLFLVQALIGTSALGHYSLTVSVAESVLLASDSLAIALLPRQTQGTLGAAAALGLRGAMFGAALAIALGLPLVFFGASIITFVFGSQFDASYPPLLVLLPGMVFLAAQRFCGAPALRANQPARFAFIFALGVVVNVVLSLLWIPAAGLVGAAASATVSYLVTSLLFLRWAWELTPKVGA